MIFVSGIILCIAYILGLLFATVAWGGYSLLVLGIAIASLSFFSRRISYRNKLLGSFWQVKPQLWVVAGLVGYVATIYVQVRTPQPSANDVSRFATPAQVVTVRGKVASTPRLTRNQRSQFWLEATGLDLANSSKQVTGRLYTTVPLLQATRLHEGEAIAVSGTLYQPNPAANPGAFDFQAYLAQEGGFAGLKGREVSLLTTKASSKWGWWAIRQRIIRSQVRWLGVPEGPLVSAMVLGNRVVDVPFDVSDSFLKVGLAHALAASGFQVSLILGIVLSLTRRFSNRFQFIVGVTALLIFLGLTGPQPSVLRAVLMGIGALTALVLQRKVKPLGLILLAATLLLLFNPSWIWNLGFEFSFLATLGLVVTVPALMKRLDWLPPAIATLIAVPIAAYIWTIPLQIYNFGLVSPYSIFVNIITTIPLSIISIGAFISAIAALIIPSFGSAFAWLLYYPTHMLIAIVEFFSHLPGVKIAVGTITTFQLTVIYGLFALVYIQKWWRQRWWIAGFIAMSLVLIPVLQAQATIFRVTILATGKEPVLVIQDKGKVLLVNSGGGNSARFTILPFLQQQGVNQIDWAIATNPLSNEDSNWLEIMQDVAIKNLYTISNGQENSILKKFGRSHRVNYQYLSTGYKVTAGSTAIEIIDGKIPALQLQIKDRTWVLLGNTKPEGQNQSALSSQLSHAQVLLWSGQPLNPILIKAVQPGVAIATATKLNEDTVSALDRGKARVFLTGKDGAIQWTPNGEFDTKIEIEDRATAL